MASTLSILRFQILIVSDGRYAFHVRVSGPP